MRSEGGPVNPHLSDRVAAVLLGFFEGPDCDCDNGKQQPDDCNWIGSDFPPVVITLSPPLISPESRASSSSGIESMF
jgi:hypothetical protein